MDEKNNVNDTVTSNNKTMEYYNNVTKSIINQTTTDVDPDINIEKEAFFLAKKAEKKLEKKKLPLFIMHLKTSKIIRGN